MSEVDLSTESAPGASGGTRIPYDPGKDREKARRTIAFSLLGLLFIVFVGVFAAEANNWFENETMADATATFITPVIGLVSFVLGFYFGEKTT